MLAAGGNAIDAAIATLFALTVVEPMMVGIIGGGMAHIRLADGSHRFIDGQSTVPRAVKPDTYRSKPGAAHDVFDTVGAENSRGPKAVAVPGSLKAWCATLRDRNRRRARARRRALQLALSGGRGLSWNDWRPWDTGSSAFADDDDLCRHARKADHAHDGERRASPPHSPSNQGCARSLSSDARSP